MLGMSKRLYSMGMLMRSTKQLGMLFILAS